MGEGYHNYFSFVNRCVNRTPPGFEGPKTEEEEVAGPLCTTDRYRWEGRRHDRVMTVGEARIAGVEVSPATIDKYPAF